MSVSKFAFGVGWGGWGGLFLFSVLKCQSKESEKIDLQDTIIYYKIIYDHAVFNEKMVVLEQKLISDFSSEILMFCFFSCEKNIWFWGMRT